MGLLKDLKPNAIVKIRDTDYIVRNVGLYTTRVHIYKELSDSNDHVTESEWKNRALEAESKLIQLKSILED